MTELERIEAIEDALLETAKTIMILWWLLYGIPAIGVFLFFLWLMGIYSLWVIIPFLLIATQSTEGKAFMKRMTK